MTCSSDRLSLLMVAILLQSLALSASTASTAPTKFIDAVCKHVNDESYCLKTLTAYPPAVAANSVLQLAYTVIDLGISYAEKTIGLIDEAVKKEATLKTPFENCREAYRRIVSCFQAASSELKESPDAANYEIMVSLDQTTVVKKTVGEAGDEASKSLMEQTTQMTSYIFIAAGATDAVRDDHQIRHP